MKTITAYVADDGTEFFSREHCERHEADLRLLADIKIPNSKLGHGKYKQHDRQFLLAIKRNLWNLVLLKHGDSWPEWRKLDPDVLHPTSIVSSVLDECGVPIARAWRQLARFNFELGREYDKPYFANHPEESTEESIA